LTRVADDFPDDENGEVLRRMQADGDDFMKARDVDFSTVFPSEVAAEEFADHFKQNGYKVSVREWDTGRDLPWDVTVTRYMFPNHAEITEMEETLDIAAARLGGRNDGWGCFRQPVQH
jgi:Regulator of ribonuclease activity B